MQPTKPNPDLWYYQPGHLKIELKEGEARVTAFDHDTEIIKFINGERFQALVPTASLGEGMAYVPAFLAGKEGDNLIVYLPTSNDGRPTWVIDESDLQKILVT